MVIFAIIGKSAAGKDTLTNSVSEKLNLRKVISCTTRPKRPKEVDGKDYHFINEDTMNELILDNQTANHTSYNVVGNEIWHYAYLKKDIEQEDNCLMVLNPEGLRDIKNEYENRKDITIVPILIDAPLEIRIERSMLRNGVDVKTLTEIVRRAIADNSDFKGINAKYTIDTSLEDAESKLIEVMTRELGNEVLRKTQREFERNPFKFLGGM